MCNSPKHLEKLPRLSSKCKKTHNYTESTVAVCELWLASVFIHTLRSLYLLY